MKKAFSFLRDITPLYILSVGILISLYGLTAKSIWYDEALSIACIQKPWSQLMYHPYIVRPFYFILLKIWALIGGYSVFWLRLFSVLTHALAGYVLYLIGKKIWNKKTALFILVLFMCSGYGIILAQQIRNYSLVILLATISVYYFLQFLESEKKTSLLCYGIASLLLIYTQFLSIFLPIVLTFYLFFIFRPSWEIKKTWLLCQLGILISCLPLPFFCMLPYVKVTLASTPGHPLHWASLFHTLEAFTYGGPFVAQGASANPLSASALIFPRLSIFLFILLILIFLRECMHHHKKILWLILVWAFAPLSIFFALSFVAPGIYKTRYLAFCMPAFFLIYGVGIAALRSHIIRIMVTAGIISAMGFFVMHYFSLSAQQTASWREVAGDLTQQNPHHALVLFLPAEQITPFWYYYQHDLKPIGDGIAGRVWYSDGQWRQNFFLQNTQCMGLSYFPQISPLTPKAWETFFLDYCKNTLVPSEKDLYLILSPGWMGHDKTALAKRILEVYYHQEWIKIYPFDGVEVIYYRNRS